MSTVAPRRERFSICRQLHRYGDICAQDRIICLGVVSSLIVVIERKKKEEETFFKENRQRNENSSLQVQGREKKERKKEKKRAWPLSLSASVDRIWTGLYKERKRRISESRPNQIPLLFTIVAFRLPDYILFLF